MSTDTSTLQSATRLLRVVDAVASHTVDGISNKALAAGLACDAAFIHRATSTLIDFGWVRKNPDTGLFHPTVAMAQVFGRVLNDLDKAERRLADLRHSMTASISR
jgi:DNA-binding IclR family transcriptional regulator